MKNTMPISIVYVGLVVCSIIVGGCAGGILGSLVRGRAHFGLALVLAGVGIFSLLSRACVSVIETNGESNANTVLALTTLAASVLGFIGAMRDIT